MATEYLDLDDAFDAYAEAVEVSVDQAKDALLNLGQLESSLARPQNAAAYEAADTVRQAATLLWGIAANRLSRWQQTYSGRHAALVPQPERV